MCFCFFHNLAPIGTTIPVGVVLAPDVPFLRRSVVGMAPTGTKVGVVLAPDVPFLPVLSIIDKTEDTSRRGTCAGCTIPTVPVGAIPTTERHVGVVLAPDVPFLPLAPGVKDINVRNIIAPLLPSMP